MIFLFPEFQTHLDYTLHLVRICFLIRRLINVSSSPDNYPEPFKRPLSSIVPVIIEHLDGSFYLAIGGAGGSRIFPSVFQVILSLDWGLGLSQAVEYARLHDQLYPMLVDVDDVYPHDILRALKQKGHNITGEALPSTPQPIALTNEHDLVEDVNRVAGVVQAVMQKDGKIFGQWRQRVVTRSNADHLHSD
jgi:gamma-glutamyltranspeptidase / glutathione hydrolase / leukotriene-C4 hydrolase